MGNRQVKIIGKMLYTVVAKWEDKCEWFFTVIPENDTLISNFCQFQTMRVRKMGISPLARKFLKVFKVFFVF